MSPGKVALRNYFRNPLGVIGLAMFVAIVLIIFVGSRMLPFDQYYSQGNLTNVSPGAGYMNYPSEMEKEGVEKISIGNTFAVGLTKENNIYVWGSNNEDDVLTIPEDVKEKIKGKKIKDVAAGDRHIIIATEDNEIYGWGNKTFDQTKVPPMQEAQIKEEGIAKLGGGTQYSVVLTNKNNLVIWGSTLASRLDMIPSTIQGEVVDFDCNTINVIVTKKDGSVDLLGVRGAENDTAMPAELREGKEKAKKLSLQETLQLPLQKMAKYSYGVHLEINYQAIRFQNLTLKS